MSTKSIDAVMFSKMFIAGAKNLESKKEWINDLNVFPVPDGDTGTNMSMTIVAAVGEVNKIENPTMENVAKAISYGSLRGARGNSGVILSQLLRGFTKVLGAYTEATPVIMAEAMERAVATAYKAVMKPKEGTILTVAKEAAQKAVEIADEEITFDSFFKQVVEQAQDTLQRTPDMLPVLKEAGVVDSGGQGLVEVMYGAYNAYRGKEIEYQFQTTPVTIRQTAAMPGAADITFGYCTEFIIMLDKTFAQPDEDQFKSFLSSIGDSIVCVADDEIVKVHVHTNDPGLAIQRALTYGALTSMKIDNMREEHNEVLIKDAEKIARAEAEANQPVEEKEVGFISVSIGEGIKKVFLELGVDYLIEGGQTMNPSTEDMLKAIESVHAKTIFIFPNNKNIILAANQAKELTEDKKIIVIPTKNIPQGITAVINYIPDNTPEENEEDMLEEIKNVKTAQITYAVRDTHIDDHEIKEKDIMGLGDSGLLSVGKEIEGVVLEAVDKLIDDDSELLSIYYGEDTSEADAQQLEEKLSQLYPQCDIELNYGGQPIYYYVISVE
ncbi:MAG: DAK2 domain-containing protein [Lachnospiraceae bacterium]